MHFADGTQQALSVLSEWMDQLGNSDEAEMPPKFSDTSKVRSLIEDIHMYLSMVKNQAGVPILYVIREDPNLPADDPGFGLPDFHTEVQLRGRHNGVFWRASNRKVWNMMPHICHDTHAWPFVSPFEATANGRGAYLAFAQHYMGLDIQHGIRQKASEVLQNATFTGENRNFTFDKFSARMTKAFNDSRYMPDEDKVIKLLHAFQVPSLTWAKGTINSNPTLRTNYDAAVSFLAQVVRENKPKSNDRNTRNLSALTGKKKPGKQTPKKGKPGKGKWKFDPKNPGRHCPDRAVYNQLSPEIKEKMRAARQSQRDGPMQKTLADLTSTIASLKTALDGKADK